MIYKVKVHYRRSKMQDIVVSELYFDTFDATKKSMKDNAIQRIKNINKKYIIVGVDNPIPIRAQRLLK